MPRYELRGVGPLSAKQQEVVDEIFRADPDNIKQINLCCGRGYGKSVMAITIAIMALFRKPGVVGLFLEPDWKRVTRVFLKKWKQIVPKELYTLNKGEQCITCINGSMLFYGPRNVTGSQDASDSAQVGQDVDFIIDDEAAIRCSQIMYSNNMGAIRNPSDVRFYLTVSTPLVGPYQNLVTGPGHKLFRGKSSDNLYLPKNYVENLRLNMSADQARRELDGEFLTLRGRIWKTAVMDKAWPNGNRHDQHTRFDPKRPWWLFCDLGSATGAYVVVQQTDADYRGRELFHDPVWVAVADLCPKDDASASRAFQKLKQEFGIPAGVVAGRDINTRDRGDGRTVSYFAQQVWGNVKIYPCDESMFSKQIQYDRLSYMMCSASNQRRFTLAKNFVSLDIESRRGVREMIDEDAWPSSDKRRVQDFLPKNKEIRVQHTRDAILMGAVQIMAPPSWLYDENPAA